MDFSLVESKMLDFLDSYLQKSGLNGFVVGVSGGVDSAVVATLCAKVAPTHALIMPTKTSSRANMDDALALVQKIGVKYEIINIGDILSAFNTAGVGGTAMRNGNLAARTRMSLLYDVSARLGYLVAGTSNKTELVLGYGTLYGDLACALNPLGNLLKTDVFALARHLGVSEKIVNKAPSADLWEGQSDEGDFGFAYADIDALIGEICAKEQAAMNDVREAVRIISNLKQYLDNSNLNSEGTENSVREVSNLKAKFDPALVDFVVNRCAANAFKLAPLPIAKVAQ